MKLRPAKALIQGALGSMPAHRVLRWTGSRRVIIFMLHRFRDAALSSRGTDPSVLRSVLTELRRRRATILSLRELIAELESGNDVSGPAVVFTVDDGYRDFLTAAAATFAAFDAPVTVFLSTRFVDGGFWCWWDRVEYAIANSPRRSVALELKDGVLRVEWETHTARPAAIDPLTERLKGLPDTDRQEVLGRLGELFDVEIPATPPPEFGAMSWDEVRRLETADVEFGPHSRTHPILSTLDDEAASDEIKGSWLDLQRECASPVPAFCYPNGKRTDYGPREVSLVRAAGLKSALATHEGYLRPASLATQDRFGLPRFPFPGDHKTALFQASGLARTDPGN